MTPCSLSRGTAEGLLASLVGAVLSLLLLLLLWLLLCCPDPGIGAANYNIWFCGSQVSCRSAAAAAAPARGQREQNLSEGLETRFCRRQQDSRKVFHTQLSLNLKFSTLNFKRVHAGLRLSGVGSAELKPSTKPKPLAPRPSIGTLNS